MELTAEKITTALNEGWELQGELIVTHNDYAVDKNDYTQAMIKDDGNSKNPYSKNSGD
jgi:hypothetical protein